MHFPMQLHGRIRVCNRDHTPLKKAWYVCECVSFCISCACSCRVNPWKGSRTCPEEMGNTWWRRRWSAAKLMGRSCSFHLVEAGCSYSESAGNREKAQKVNTRDVGKSLQYFKGHSVFCIMLQRSSDVNALREETVPENEEWKIRWFYRTRAISSETD